MVVLSAIMMPKLQSPDIEGVYEWIIEQRKGIDILHHPGWAVKDGEMISKKFL